MPKCRRDQRTFAKWLVVMVTVETILIFTIMHLEHGWAELAAEEKRAALERIGNKKSDFKYGHERRWRRSYREGGALYHKNNIEGRGILAKNIGGERRVDLNARSFNVKQGQELMSLTHWESQSVKGHQGSRSRPSTKPNSQLLSMMRDVTSL